MKTPFLMPEEYILYLAQDLNAYLGQLKLLVTIRRVLTTMGKTKECNHCGQIMLQKKLVRQKQERHKPPAEIRWFMCLTAGCSF